MTEESNRKRLPPYISYRTFDNFLSRLQPKVPARIDRSFWGDSFSGSTGVQLMAALRFLNLIDANGIPTSKLTKLASARGDDRLAVLKQITSEAYGFVLSSSLDMQSATLAQLEENFQYNFQLTKDVRRKCIKFFISLANSSRTNISPFFTTRNRSTTLGTANSSGKNSGGKSGKSSNKNIQVPNKPFEIPDKIPNMSPHILLLAKFPVFDPSWAAEVQSKWFDGFLTLMKFFTSHD